jgi:hypothetical protein
VTLTKAQPGTAISSAWTKPAATSSQTSNAMVTFRDPDNIQLEFFWRPPKP